LNQPLTPAAPRLRLFGLLAAIVIGGILLVVPAPEGLTAPAWRMAALFAVALVLWATEAIPIAVTALLVLVLQPLLGIAGLRPAFAASMSPVFFFVLAMFCISTAFSVSGLDRRFALSLLARAGADSRRVLLAFMVGTAAISSLLSDVPACAIFMAIALGLFAANDVQPRSPRFGKAVMIGIPFASLIGGVATPAGSSINILGIEFIEKFGGVRVPFLDWMAIGVPMAVLMTPLAWWVLVLCFSPEKDAIKDVEALARERAALGPLQPAEWKLIGFLGAMLALWIASTWIKALDVTLVALCGSIAMFLPGIGMVEWKQVERGTGWDTLLMIAGVSSIGVASVDTGLARWIVERSMGGIEGWSTLGIVAAISVFTVVVHLVLPIGPVINATLIPPIALLAVESGQSPVLYALPVAFTASCAFLLPLDPVPLLTYGRGYYRMFDMLLPGAILSVVWVVLMTVLMLTIAPAIGLL
jgi:sodium-dependent dicarboxylate transporter 2/3/5